MKRTVLTPILVLSGIITSCVLMAVTTVFDPLILFIHTGDITPLQAGACLLFTGAGFAAAFYLLNLLCSFFVPPIGTGYQSSGANSQTQHIGEV